MKWCRLVVEEAWEVPETAFRANCRLITNMVAFNHLGCILTATDNKRVLVVTNLRMARNKWVKMTSIIKQKGVNVRMFGKFFKSVV